LSIQFCHASPTQVSVQGVYGPKGTRCASFSLVPANLVAHAWSMALDTDGRRWYKSASEPSSKRIVFVSGDRTRTQIGSSSLTTSLWPIAVLELVVHIGRLGIPSHATTAKRNPVILRVPGFSFATIAIMVACPASIRPQATHSKAPLATTKTCVVQPVDHARASGTCSRRLVLATMPALTILEVRRKLQTSPLVTHIDATWGRICCKKCRP
jgi:hypothetical protein